MKWYKYSTKLQKLVYMLLIRNQKKLTIKVFGMYEMNLQLFSRSLRVTYSLVNIITVAVKN